MGTNLVFIPSFRYPGKSKGRPAPEKITSIFSRRAVLTRSLKSVNATMILAPRTPLVNSLALRISRLRTRRLAWTLLS